MASTVEILEWLVRHDTVSANSNLPLVDELERFLTKIGARVTRLSDPHEPKAGLYAEVGPPGPGIVLSAHTDVVPVEGQSWTTAPFQLSGKDDKLYGRGTTDMKGFLAAMLSLASRANISEMQEPIKLVISYDEEIGCVGIAQMLDRLRLLIGAPRLAIVGEPTEMQVATGHKGKQAFVAHVLGEAGHSALAPRFVNAVNVAADFVQELQRLQIELEANVSQDLAYDIPYSTIHVGRIQGGRALNMVPEKAEVTFEVRHLPKDDPDALRLRLEDLAKNTSARHGETSRIKLKMITAYPGLETDPTSRAARLVQKLAKTNFTKVAFGTEAGFFEHLGVPTLVCGPGSMEGQGHKADEYITKGQLSACDAMLDRVLMQLHSD
ncbi:MAG: acetylornithine deacetylase [Pseudomonadota bacterium]